jgi:hypothetical protein
VVVSVAGGGKVAVGGAASTVGTGVSRTGAGVSVGGGKSGVELVLQAAAMTRKTTTAQSFSTELDIFFSLKGQ